MTSTRTADAPCAPAPAPPSPSPLKILIADDLSINRMMLRAMLREDGFEVIEAANGREAVTVFERERPDLVVMDVMMPVMDGYEATRLIKAAAGDRFVPVLFLTAVTDENQLAQCVTAGGDDFMTKPHTRTILKAKIDALTRIRALYTTIQAQHDELARHAARAHWEQEVARTIFANIIGSGSLDHPRIKYRLSPASILNGDLLMAAQRPSGQLLVMLGDFTGHGLPAAIGTAPLAEMFSVMAARGFSISAIVTEMNQKLKRILPPGLFCAACLLEWDPAERTLTVWNGGLPDVLIARLPDGVHTRIPSRHIPLGVVDNSRLDASVEHRALGEHDRIYLYSDGLIECAGARDERYGQPRLEQSIAAAHTAGKIFEAILGGVTAFQGSALQQDDLTLIEIACEGFSAVPGEPRRESEHAHSASADWHLSLSLSSAVLRELDPLPQIIRMVSDIQSLAPHKERIYAVLAELVANGLDHGLLKLDSTLKHTLDGFAEYYAERERRLADQREGSITVRLCHRPTPEGGQLIIRVEDSGDGFDFRLEVPPLNTNLGYSGRGLPLVRSICRELVFHGKGNCAEATYVW